MTRRVRWVAARAAVLALAFGAAGGPALAQGDVGVAMDPGQLAVREPIAAGAEMSLPPVSVRNPGSVVTTYRLGGDGYVTDEAKSAEASWFRVVPTTVDVRPGESRPVVAQLRVPAKTAAGRYVGLVTAQAVPGGVGTQVGAAVGVRVYFDVTAAARRDAGFPVAAAIGLGGAALAAAALVAARRSGLRLRVDRVRNDGA